MAVKATLYDTIMMNTYYAFGKSHTMYNTKSEP